MFLISKKFIVLIHHEGTAFRGNVSNLDIYPFRLTLSAQKII